MREGGREGGKKREKKGGKEGGRTKKRDRKVGKKYKTKKKEGSLRLERARALVHARHDTAQARTHTARSLVVYTPGPMHDDGPRRLLRHIE